MILSQIALAVGLRGGDFNTVIPILSTEYAHSLVRRRCVADHARTAGYDQPGIAEPAGRDVGNDNTPRPNAKVPAAIAATGPEIGAQSSILTFSALFTMRTPSVARAIEIARSAASWVGTLPFRVTTP